MPIRNPFRRAGGAETLDGSRNGAERGFSNTSGGGTKPLDIKEPIEYKLSGESLLHPVWTLSRAL
jgi:hypothetical protein